MANKAEPAAKVELTVRDLRLLQESIALTLQTKREKWYQADLDALETVRHLFKWHEGRLAS